MHMADALLSPTVGGTMWATSAATLVYSSAKLRRDFDERVPPLMGVLGAFLFAAQMINFTIPGTGSSGHLAGGVLLAILLGPYAAFLSIASVLVVQALFFADGGLLALGCNIFNMAFVPAFMVFPLFRRLTGNTPSPLRLNVAILTAAVLALQLGAFAVVLETTGSGIASLPFASFLLLMQPIHLAIGIVEGLVTIAVLGLARKARPDLLRGSLEGRFDLGGKRVLLAFLVAALLVGGGVSRYASELPDGLEWAVGRLTGKTELAGPTRGIHSVLGDVQTRTAVLSGYQLPAPARKEAGPAPERASTGNGTGVAGVVGAILTLVVACCCPFLFRRGRQGSEIPPKSAPSKRGVPSPSRRGTG